MTGPCFDNILRILNREAPARPTLFEFILNEPLCRKAVAGNLPPADDPLSYPRLVVRAYARLGYDFAAVAGSEFSFEAAQVKELESRSLNEGVMITDRASFDAYGWNDPNDADYSRLDVLGEELPRGMKLMVFGPGGVLENVIMLTGYDNLCFMIADDPELTRKVFDAVGSRLVRYYEIAAEYGSVGVIMSNDDWGYKTQTMLSPDDMRKYCFPWHRKIVETCHRAGKPVVLHSCGNLKEVMGDVMDMGYDGKHSYEDAIQPVEEFYEEYHEGIAILGGIDVDFLCRSTPEEIRSRSQKMLERSRERGSYALGTGNSVPEYIPDEHYMAMITAAGA